MISGLVVRLLCAVLAVGALASCGEDPPPPAPAASARPLSETEAERLAVMRFRNYEARGAQFSAVVPDRGQQVLVSGYLNYRARVGWAIVRAQGSSEVTLVQWNKGARLLWQREFVGVTPPPELPPAQSEFQRFAPNTSAVDSVLFILLALAKDRPDNPQLLRQSDAQWLRKDQVGGVEVDVVQGPSAPTGDQTGDQAVPAGPGRVSYWIDEQGTPLRVDVNLGEGIAVLDFDTEAYVPFEVAKRLRTTT